MNNENINLDDEWNEDEDTMRDQYLTFKIADEVFGFGIEYVTEIVGMQTITVVPEMENFVKGVVNLRGSVIPVIDVRLRFGQPEREYDERTCIIVVKINELSVGLIVDIVQEVIDIPESQISPPPSVYSGSGSDYLYGMGKLAETVAILINVSRLLGDDKLEQLESMA